MPDETLNQAIALIRSGQKESARAILTQLIQVEPRNATAWLWLAETEPDDNRRIAVLEACLKLNPQSQMVRRGLERLRARQVSARKPSIETTPTVPVPPSDQPEKDSSSLNQDIQSAQSFQPEAIEAPVLPLAEPPTQPLPPDYLAAEDINTLREALTGEAKSSKNKRTPVLPVAVEIPTPAEAKARNREQLEPAAETNTQPRRKPGGEAKPAAGRRRQSCGRWLILVGMGLLAAVVVGFTGYIMQDQLRAWLGLPGAVVTPTFEGSLLTPGGDNFAALTTPTRPIPTSTLTPTPTITPVPTPTATVAFSFTYPVIAPENGAQVIQVGELSSAPARCVAISSDNRMLAAGMDDATVYIWNLLAGNILYIFEGHTKPVNAVAFSPDNSFLVSGSDDGTLRIWDLNAGKEVRTLIGHVNAVISVAFSPDGSHFASGSLDGILNVWQMGSDTAVNSLPGDEPVTSLDFSPDGRLLALGLQTGAIKVWDVAPGSMLKTLLGHNGAVNSVEFAPSGHRLATGSSDKTVKLWDVDSGKVLYTIGSHTEAVLSVSFSPDGRVLASSSIGQTIKLWDVAERSEIAVLRHARNMPEVAFSQDGRVLAAALSPTNPESQEGGVALWGVLSTAEATPAYESLTLDDLQINEWLPGARMAVPHVAHQAVPVTGGRVLIIGGGSWEDPVSFTHKVELYNPASGISLFTGGLDTGRGSFSATLLKDGRVLVVWGYNASEQWVAGAEIYDPVSGAWSLNQPLYNHGIGHTATLLVDGRVLVAGGCMGDGIPGRSNRAELFDPATNSWTETSAMDQSRCGHFAVLLTNGWVLVAGGEDGEGYLSSAEVFDPVTGRWSQTGELNMARIDAVVVQLVDGRAMVIGGMAQIGGNLVTLNTVEIYDANYENKPDGLHRPASGACLPRFTLPTVPQYPTVGAPAGDGYPPDVESSQASVLQAFRSGIFPGSTRRAGDRPDCRSQ